MALKRIVTIFTALYLSLTIKSNAKSDSLFSVLEKTKEKNKTELFYQLCNTYYIINLDTVKLFAEEGLQLAEKYNQHQYSALFYKVIGNVYNYLGDYNLSRNYYDTALFIAKENNLDNQTGTLYSNIGTLFEAEGNLTEALAYYKRAYTTDSLIANKVGINNATHNIGSIHLKLGHYPEAIRYMKMALELSREQDDYIGTYGALNNLGLAYYHITDYKTAVDYFIQCLELADKMGDAYYQSFVLVNLGTLYNDWENHSLAIEYFEKALVTSKQSENPSNYVFALTNIGSLWDAKQEYDSALYYLNAALEKAQEIDDEYTQASIYSGLGTTYQSLKNYDKSKAYFLKSLELRKRFDINYDIGKSYYNLARLAYLTKDYDEAISWAEKCCTHATDKSPLIENYNLLSCIYEAQNNAAKALFWHKRYSELKDSVFSDEKHIHIQNLQTQYETERKEAEIQNLKTKADIQELRYQKTRLIGGFLIVVLLLIVLVSYFIYRQRKLLDEKKIAQSEQKHLRLQMNPHFIFNALSAIQNYILKNDALTAGSYLSKFAKLMRTILTSSKTEFISLSTEIEALTNYLELQKIRLEGKLSFSIREPDANTDEIKIPGMLAQPFIENSIEHGILKKDDQQGEIRITYFTNDDSLNIEIIDNGIGREKAGQLKEGNHQSMATSIINERLKILGKKFKNSGVSIIDLYGNDNQPQGTKVVINLPLIEE